VSTTVFFADRNLGRAFPDSLRAAGLTVERHDDHFTSNTLDETWIPVVASRGWIALSHDVRIRYRPNEQAAVLEARLGLILIGGKAPFPELAAHFVTTYPRIERFLAKNTPPFIAKVLPPSPAERANKRNPRGTIQLLLP
jgi:hypothetical protein